MARAKRPGNFPRGVNVKNYRVKEGNVTIDVSFLDPEGMINRLCDILIQELRPVMEKMVAKAKGLCPVGGIIREGNDPTHRRKPGTLRKSIKGTVARRKDKTAVLGFLEAGNDDAYYAVMVEFGPVSGVQNWTWTPYLRPAFNMYVGEARAAVARGVQRFAEGR